MSRAAESDPPPAPDSPPAAPMPPPAAPAPPPQPPSALRSGGGYPQARPEPQLAPQTYPSRPMPAWSQPAGAALGQSPRCGPMARPGGGYAYAGAMAGGGRYMPRSTGPGAWARHRVLVLALVLVGLNLLSAVAVRLGLLPGRAMAVWALASSGLVIFWAVVARERVVPLLTRVGKWRYWLAGAAGGVCTWFVGHALIWILVSLLDLPTISLPQVFEEAGLAHWVVVACIVIQPPIIEELAFRGIIFTGLKRTMKAGDALWISALLFMALHMQPLMFPHTLALGLLTGILLLRNGSIYPCILAHAVHNALALWVSNT